MKCQFLLLPKESRSGTFRIVLLVFSLFLLGLSGHLRDVVEEGGDAGEAVGEAALAAAAGHEAGDAHLHVPGKVCFITD